MLSMNAYGYLADMFNAIENGASWPEQLTSAGAAFLSKNPNDELNPLAYRVLLMLPALYRMLSKTRLRHLPPWIAEWAMPEMHAGVEGRGAQDVAYNTALLTEWCQAMNLDLTGGAADIFKCFDQLSRPLIYAILEKAGVRPRVLETCRKFIGSLTTYNTVAGGLGEAYTKPTSIPQGDPFSMLIVAVILRAWVVQMKSLGVQPRLLADDLLLLSIGTRHLEHFTHAFDKTHGHMEAIRARIASEGCYTCHTNTTAREWLRSHRWRRIQQTV